MSSEYTRISLWNFCRLSFLKIEECLNRKFHLLKYFLSIYSPTIWMQFDTSCELFWAIFAFTTLFGSWNMVLQPNFFFHCFRHRTKVNELLPVNSLLFVAVNKGTATPASSISSQTNTLNIFFWKRHLNMEVLKNFLFPKIDFKRDIIPAKTWFPFGKLLLANNMTSLDCVS